MCLFSAPKVDVPRTPSTPVKRANGPLNSIFARRRSQARSTFGNLHTSPLGVTNRAATQATTLGSGGAITL